MNIISSAAFPGLANAELWSQALWFVASVCGVVFTVATAALALEIVSAATEPHRAPGAEFMGLSHLPVRSDQ